MKTYWIVYQTSGGFASPLRPGGEQLLHPVHAVGASEIIEDVAHWVRPALTAVGSDLKDVLTRLVEYIGENADICSVLLSDKGDTSFQTQVVNVIEGQFMSSWAAARKLSQEEAEYLYTFIALGSVGLIRKWLSDGAKKPASEIAELILKISNAGFYGI